MSETVEVTNPDYAAYLRYREMGMSHSEATECFDLDALLRSAHRLYQESPPCGKLF